MLYCWVLQTKEGETFESETDTEVIPKLCNFLYKRLPESIPFPQVRQLGAAVCSVFSPPSKNSASFPASKAKHMHSSSNSNSLFPTYLHLSAYARPACPAQLVCEVVKQLEGAYALLIKSSVYPGELVACRRGSPLILGMKYGIQVGLAADVAGELVRSGSSQTPLAKCRHTGTEKHTPTPIAIFCAGCCHPQDPSQPFHPPDPQGHRLFHHRPAVL